MPHNPHPVGTEAHHDWEMAELVDNYFPREMRYWALESANLWRCNGCGALVCRHDRVMHAQWHETLSEALSR